MTTQQRYNILSTYNRTYINQQLGTNYKDLAAVDRDVWLIYEQLLALDPAFIARDLALCEAELVALGQHTNN